MQRHELHLHYNEIEMLKVCCGHKNIVNLLDYYEDAHEIYIVTEFIDGPDFYDYIKRVSLSERMLKDIISEVCCGL